MESEQRKVPELSVASQTKIITGLIELVQICHGTAAAKGFWDKPRDVARMLMLQVTELAEACEWDRKGNPKSDHIPDFTGIEEELADAVIRICDMAGGMGLNLPSALIAKMQYNQNREFMHGKKF